MTSAKQTSISRSESTPNVAKYIYNMTACSPPFSLKIPLVLISSSAIANHDVIITIITIIFLLGLTPSFLAARGSRLCRSRAQVSRAVTLQRKIRDCSQSIYNCNQSIMMEILTLCHGIPLRSGAQFISSFRNNT